MRFVINPTSPYTDRSAGIAALHRLCHWLNVLGHDASLVADGLNPDWETKTWDGTITDDTIAIYPEVVRGNPQGAPKVVRWCLSHPGHHYFDSPSTLDPCDAVFYYADRFKAATLAAAPAGVPVGRLFVNVYPRDAFFPGDFERPRDMFYVGRGWNALNAFHHLVDLREADQFRGGYATRYQLAKALRRVRTFYCFDQVSAILAESMLCGAKGVLIREDGVVVEVERNGIETMGVFEREPFDDPGDVRHLLWAMGRL